MKLYNVKISQRNLVTTGINTALPAIDKKVLVALTPSSLGILVYKDLTSMVTNNVFSSISVHVFSFLMKSFVSLT